MRYLALLALVMTTVLSTSAADVDAGEMADVRVSHCSAYDPNDCGADGCTCEKTRDGRLASYSRWSCAPDLIMKPCEMCYSFDPPQDIEGIRVAFYKGDMRQKRFSVKLYHANGVDDTEYEFTSGADTEGFEYYTLEGEETQELCIECVDLDYSEWCSIVEVEILVQG